VAPPFGRANDPDGVFPRAPVPAIPELDTVGRENARAGGTAAARPAVTPSRLSRVGFTGTLPPREAPANWLADILTPIPRTGIELVRARCETAIVPPGALKFA
jgi:hypothetical protein